MKTVQATRRRLMLTAAGAMILPALPLGQALSQGRGDTVRLLVGYPPGGATDVITRALQTPLSEVLGKTVIVENKPGASGTLAIREIEGSAPDEEVYGVYLTLSLLGSVLNGEVPDLSKITPISQLYEQYTVTAVNPAVAGLENVHSIQDLIAVAKARNGQLSYTSSSVGSTGHLTMEWLCNLAGVRMQHIAYKGGAPAVVDVLGGHVGIIVTDTTVIGPHIRSGKVRAIAINYPSRVNEFPDVPTITEQGFKELSATPWATLVGPPDMEKARVDGMAAAIQKVLSDPELVARMRELTVFARHSTPDQARELMERDLRLWRKVIEDNKITA
jgi:tripartite-type tricarboxylate transporter receptor subunit TctC